jgi:predicted DNA-binding transcriptional regulator AlpA
MAWTTNINTHTSPVVASKNKAIEPADRFVKIDYPLNMFQISRSNLYTKIAEKTFPAPVRIDGALRWSLRELESYAEELKNNR